MSAILPMVKMNPKDIPMGLVVADQGPIGASLAKGLQEKAPDLVKFTQYNSVEKLKVAMDEREVYGALVVPADFSGKVATLQTAAPQKAIVQL